MPRPMPRRLVLVTLGLAAAASTALAPSASAAPDSLAVERDEVTAGDPFPAGFCLRARPINDGRYICVIVNDPR
jgi:hypothetical protein